MGYPSGISDQELLKELGGEIRFQRVMIHMLHRLPADTLQERRDRLWEIQDDYARALCVAYELLTGVKITW